MSRRINVMIEEDTWRLLDQIPVGERSRAINQALRVWMRRRRRADVLRTQLPAVSTEEITRWIREDRDAGH
jgi:predicted CopG family antitoxin